MMKAAHQPIPSESCRSVASISIANITNATRFSIIELPKQMRQLTVLFDVEAVLVNIVDLEIALAGQWVAVLNQRSECRV
jgi:hypothetical protein